MKLQNPGIQRIPEAAGRSLLRNRIPELDGVRGLAMVLVLIWHYLTCQVQTTAGSTSAYAMKLLSFTWAGVDLFFVLSGFLIGGILLNQRSADNYFGAFYARRLFRIFPLYMIMLGLFYAATMVDAAKWGTGYAWLFSDPLPLWSYATYLQNFAMTSAGTHGPHWLGITWSLAIEEQFYLILPPLIRFIPSRCLPWLLGMLALSAPMIRGALLNSYSHGEIAGYVLLPARWDALFFGVLGAIALRNEAGRNWLLRHTALIRSVSVLCGIIIIGLLVKNQGIGSWGMSWFGHTTMAILSLGLILLATISTRSRTGRIFRNPVLIGMGTISYGVYLMHQPIAGLLHALIRNQAPRITNMNDALVTLLALAITLALACLSWRFFERPLVQIGQHAKYEGLPR